MILLGTSPSPVSNCLFRFAFIKMSKILLYNVVEVFYRSNSQDLAENNLELLIDRKFLRFFSGLLSVPVLKLDSRMILNSGSFEFLCTKSDLIENWGFVLGFSSRKLP